MLSLKAVSRKDYFWQNEIGAAIKAVRANKNLVVKCREKTGKTTFLLALSEKLSSEENKSSRAVPVIFSTKNCTDINAYIKKNLRAVLDAYPNLFGQNPKKLFELPITDIGKTISEINIGKKIKELLTFLLLAEKQQETDVKEVVRQFFEFITLVTEENKTKTVILIDDADNLQNLKSDRKNEKQKRAAEYLLEFIDKRQENKNNVLFVFTTSHQAILRLKNADHIELRAFSIEETKHFFSQNKINLDESALNLIYNSTGGIPFYVNFFGRMLSITGMNTASAINKLVEDVIANELHIYFSEKIKQLSPKELPILFCMAEHNVNTPSRISRLLNYSQTNVRRFLSIMEEKGFVVLIERGIFEIHDPMLKKWLENQSNS